MVINMSKIHLLTGGAKSGKSKWAVSYFNNVENVLYVTAGEGIQDEVKAKIDALNEERTEKWTILSHNETPSDVISETKRFVIYDSIAGYVSIKLKETVKNPNEITDEQVKSLKKKIEADVSALISKAHANETHLIILTNETGFSALPDSKYQLAFRDIVGAANQLLGEAADEVYMSISGIQMKIK